jgi:hypothetical protein
VGDDVTPYRLFGVSAGEHRSSINLGDNLVGNDYGNAKLIRHSLEHSQKSTE